MTARPKSFSVTKRRRYADLQQQQVFLRSVMARKVTPEVSEFLGAASDRSRKASSAKFLDRFRAPVSA